MEGIIQMNNSMIGPIFLSPNNSIEIHPSKKSIEERNKFFENFASSMDIHTTGTDSTVNFHDLDLSALDK